MTPLLNAEKLSVAYHQKQAVYEVDLTINAGQIVSVIGANGAGKSSLMNALMGNLPTYGKVQGQIYFQGQLVNRCTVEERVAQGLCLVPESRELFASMNVRDNLLLGGFRRYVQCEHNWRRSLNDIYDLFPRLQERSQQTAGTLSGGERQMLALGRALMGKPALLMLDEPSLGLAPLVVKEIFHIIQQLKQTGVAILLVEQNARVALHIADYGYVLEMGKVNLEGMSATLLHHPGVIESYLGLGHKTSTA